MSFANLKKSKGSGLDRLVKAVEAKSSGYDSDQSEYWKLTLDKAGNGMATIRFLPISPKDTHNPDALEWVKYWDHGFQGPTGLWYIEKSLTTIGQQDAIALYNKELWDSGIEANQKIVREKQKRRLHFVSNIYVVKDAANPENEGKVFKYVYGRKIHDRILQALKPAFDDEENPAFDPFDLWSGANFKLKARKVDNQVNYDLSEWSKPGPLSDDDSELEKIYNSTYSLLEIIDPKQFKSPAELETRLKRVLGLDSPKTSFMSSAEKATRSRIEEDDDVVEFTKPTVQEKPKAKPAPTISMDEDEDDDLSYFSKLIDDE